MEERTTTPLILITNDDGITAPGIENLVEAMRGLGTLVVVAPDSPQSGMGHAITIGRPLRLNKLHQFPGVESYQCSGTPVDCVKLATNKILDRKPDICVSGINHGTNASINVIYSGTMSAAMEAAIEGIPSVGCSLADFSFEADFSVAREVIRKVVMQMLAEPLPPHTLLNVNIPKVSKEEFNGIRFCRQANAKWGESFEHRVDPYGKDYYWMVGNFICEDLSEDTDIYALRNNYASIVPVQFDLTDYRSIEMLKKKWPSLR
ncbi:5'/3'-nucleotidase SurE [Rurimicrobium arvi]|uniref:5'-nucleotidase SurE n=1 Tax=Rurimicrobium arvi TaxID=2049916 RepID=A0ABP8MTK9_9BACT